MVKSTYHKNKVDPIIVLSSEGKYSPTFITQLYSATSNLHAIPWACLVAECVERGDV